VWQHALSATQNLRQEGEKLVQHGVFECPRCGRFYAEELPPFGEALPRCCGRYSRLIAPLIRIASTLAVIGVLAADLVT
jgi:hypothetical protein